MKTAEQQFSRHVSVAPDEGIRVDKAVIIEKPVHEVYSFWRNLSNLSRFMRHVESVEVQDDLHSHWAVQTLAGKVVEWDAEIIEQRENEMISWRSTPGADVDNAGSVWFSSVPGGQGTVVRVEMKYIPPAGNTGGFVAGLFGKDAASEIQEDLSRLKTFLETGTLPEAGTNSGWQTRIREAGRNAFQAVDECVRQHPWNAAGTAALVFFAVGILIGLQTRR
jgi:uncharacterized membrane protein